MKATSFPRYVQKFSVAYIIRNMHHIHRLMHFLELAKSEAALEKLLKFAE